MGRLSILLQSFAKGGSGEGKGWAYLQRCSEDLDVGRGHWAFDLHGGILAREEL